MITLNNVGRMKKCNLWIDDIPNIEYQSLEVLNKSIVKNNWVTWDTVSYAVEIRIIGRHASNYALLGMRYKYEDINMLNINVNASQFNGKIIESTIASLDDEIHMGLPIEYAHEVFKSCEKYFETAPCSPGQIVFDIAAHGYVGSSSNIFRQVAELLLKLLVNNDKKDVEKIEKIIFEELSI